jgi:2',3'-cyclic-nucleotide 2'-phosphodiesterase (5'-nucleotidase family)
MNRQANLHDSATAAMIAPYKDSLDRIMNEVLVVSDQAMPKERDKTETLLGNFTADVVLWKARTLNCDMAGTKGNSASPAPCADLCLLNTGGLRSSLPQGKITRGNMFELMPFDNEIVIVTLSGKKTWELLHYVGATGGQPMAGIKMGLKADKSPGTVLIQGMPLDTSKIYQVATSDYLANGGDKMDFFKKPIAITSTGIKIRDALIDFCLAENKKGNQLHPHLDERIYYETK